MDLSGSSEICITTYKLLFIMEVGGSPVAKLMNDIGEDRYKNLVLLKIRCVEVLRHINIPLAKYGSLENKVLPQESSLSFYSGKKLQDPRLITLAFP
ncbi:hypothetical protein TNCV_1558261 [Trichonephila clavipes]|uniref:Uncharacterized protein n=1 Tax=Trichonephila clavipes TaxID=2585209 RepID=A0A8X6R5H8_TRICX|nr:hypothetical protein TNCV_1558261 [Trichonephila clavipes]